MDLNELVTCRNNQNKKSESIRNSKNIKIEENYAQSN